MSRKSHQNVDTKPSSTHSQMHPVPHQDDPRYNYESRRSGASKGYRNESYSQRHTQSQLSLEGYERYHKLDMNRKSHQDVDTKPSSTYSHMHPVPLQDVQRYNYESRRSGASKGYRGEKYTQTQMQSQLQRSLEASKQMLYGTFENLIASLEEYEQREQKQTDPPLSRSNIRRPDQSRKKNSDVKANVETQILLFEKQSKACPPEVLAELKEGLRHKTLGWTAVRAGIPGIQSTDGYISKVYEILARGKTDHKVPSCENVTEDVMRDTFQNVIYGDHDRQQLDSAFKNDPRKKAMAPNTRHSEMLDEGARRISGAYGRPDLDSYLKDDIQKMRSYGPRDLK